MLVKEGKLVSENYYNGRDPQSLLHIRSITKSISSLLIGIALDQGTIDSLTIPIISYYPGYMPEDSKSRVHDITVQHILNMQSGFEWNENSEAINWYTSVSNPLNYIFSKPVTEPPGSSWNYNSGAVHLLSRVFTKSTGMPQQDFAEKYLFNPLEIESFTWQKDPTNVTRPDAGLALRTRDLAKIGLLILENGQYENDQLVPSVWIEKSASFNINLDSSYGPIENLHYNNLWWMGRYKKVKIIFGLGYGGQLLLMVPEFELIVIANHKYRLPGNIVAQHSQDFLSQIFIPLLDHISQITKG